MFQRLSGWRRAARLSVLLLLAGVASAGALFVLRPGSLPALVQRHLPARSPERAAGSAGNSAADPLAAAAASGNRAGFPAEADPAGSEPPVIADLPGEVPGRPMVRVCLTDPAMEQVILAAAGPVTVRPVGSPEVLGRFPSLNRAGCTTTRTGLKIGTRSFAASQLELIPARSPDLWVGRHQYRGTIRLYRQTSNRVLAVNVLPLEDYIASVINGEMPAAFDQPAREAQAIVARTYVLYQLMRPGRQQRLFDVYASTRSQHYQGTQYETSGGRKLAGETPRSRQITAATAGVVCTWNNRLFCTYYSAVCGGQTAAGNGVFSDAAPPVASVPCEWCSKAERYRWSVEVPRAVFRERLSGRTSLNHSSPLTAIRQAAATVPGRPPDFEIHAGRKSARINASSVRRMLSGYSLHSSRFELSLETDDVRVTGRGHGHGVGLCQWGAAGMAGAGHSCTEIISHYYPGAQLLRLLPPAVSVSASAR
ncbi:MAG: SpoIID/LytB domain-containing protein [Planctomycetaceae bacterium]|nr:SpoIID/LytB domain-containing protein [Planctomycetaceae bacterium]